MVGTVLLILYAALSLAGGMIGLFAKRHNGKARLAVALFSICHACLLTLGLLKSVSLSWLITAMIACIGTRILNGRVLHGQNNWRHYIVTGSMMTVIIILKMRDV
ncbi:hypothetical protein ACFO4N_15060 [Camelliibacillus cellulosilyticus]|uniref:Uncharacterized protein n=1 Tax=Camelliibacillus cellulosilyticus TaxID=2174486 RepID=A0ABV9GS03_9BACL